MGNCLPEGGRGLFSSDDLRPIDIAARYHVNEQVQVWYTLSRDPGAFHFGTSSTAELGLVMRRGRKYAMKTVSKAEWVCKNEVKIFILLDHPHVVRLVDVFDLNDEISMVMELLEGGELLDRVLDGGNFSEKDAADACHQMLSAVAHLHGQDTPILHGDLKPENFMYTRPGSNKLKLIDFGHAHVGPACEKERGTSGYQAPEVDPKLSRFPRLTDRSDVFSLGVTAYLLLTGKLPFSPKQGPRQELLEKAWGKPWFLRLSPEAQSFLRALMEYNADLRPTALAALELPWITSRERPEMQAARLAPETMASLRSYAKSSRFTKACLRMMASSLTFEDQQRVGEIFMEVDQDRDGKITLDEFKRCLESRFTINDPNIEALFRNLGDSGEEVISYTDFMAATERQRLRMNEDALKDVFRRFDKNNSGFISLHDLQVALDTRFNESEAADLIRELGGGTNGQVPYEAFFDYLFREEPEPDAAEPREERTPMVSKAERRRVHFCLAAMRAERELKEDEERENQTRVSHSFAHRGSCSKRVAPMQWHPTGAKTFT